jgi:catechol 2,3-dioxygenase-like lactoylglutathione lyase family enzyme
VAIELDHIMVPSRDRNAAAEQLASILGVEWAPANVGPFTAVYVNSSLTIDFDEWQEDFPKGHYCFRVDDDNFEEVLSRLKSAEIPYRSQPHGADDYQVNTSLCGKIVYWNQPDGHVWELLTKSYARAD